MKSVLLDTENPNSPIFVTKRSSILSMFTKDNKLIVVTKIHLNIQFYILVYYWWFQCCDANKQYHDTHLLQLNFLSPK